MSEFAFDKGFQDEMLTLMIKDLSFTDKVVKYIPQERLYSDAHKFLFGEIKKKYEESGSVPSYIEIEDRLKHTERAKRRMFKNFSKDIYEGGIADGDFIKDKLTHYAKRSAFVELFQDSQVLYNAKKYEDAFALTMEGMGELYGISFSDDIAIDAGDFEGVRQRYIKSSLLVGNRVPTGIQVLDNILNGGLEKGELGILLAEAKRGKSIGLVHMGCVALMRGAGRVAHFVLEGTPEQAVMRYQSRLSGIEYSRIAKDEIASEEQKKLDYISEKYTTRLELVPMNAHWNYTVLDIETKIKELERRKLKPDLVIIDYADLLKGHVKTNSTREEQTLVYRHVKQMAMIYKVAIWTAAQAQRPSEDPEKVTLLRAKNVAECYEKVRIADFVATLNQTPREKGLGVLRFHLDIYRSNETDRTLLLMVDFTRMIFHSNTYATAEREHLPSWFFSNRKAKKK